MGPDNTAKGTKAPKVKKVGAKKRGIVVKLTDETLASIDLAVEKFSKLGLTKRKAAALVADALQEHARSIDAVELFNTDVKKLLGLA